MTMTTLAVYENGVLRPAGPLPLAEGETVELAVSRVQKPPSEEAVIGRIKAAKNLTELFAAYESLPAPPDGYDLMTALARNRELAGEVPLTGEESR
jgi:predicted DNA-binding antitoxin AbrB/MazE fold protein